MTITINGLNIGDVYAGGTRIKRIYRGGGGICFWPQGAQKADFHRVRQHCFPRFADFRHHHRRRRRRGERRLGERPQRLDRAGDRRARRKDDTLGRERPRLCGQDMRFYGRRGRAARSAKPMGQVLRFQRVDSRRNDKRSVVRTDRDGRLPGLYGRAFPNNGQPKRRGNGRKQVQRGVYGRLSEFGCRRAAVNGGCRQSRNCRQGRLCDYRV